MHNEYRRIINTRYLNAKPSTVKAMSSFVRRLPDPDELTKDWILEFLSQFSNPNTKFCNFFRQRIILKELGKEELLSGIQMKTPEPSLARSDFITTDQVASLLRASRTLSQRALIEFLLESGARIGEALNLTKQNVRAQQDFVLVTLKGKTGIRDVPLLKDNLTSFLYHYAICESDRLFPFKYTAILGQMKRSYKRANVSVKKPNHIFRHMKATYLMELGVPEHLIKRFLGWSKNSDMISRYTHLTSKDIESFFARLYGVNEEPVEPLYPEEEKQKLKQVFR